MQTKTNVKCPIPGCVFTFQRGTRGWATHVGAVANHPHWHPDHVAPENRRNDFRKEFPEWFQEGVVYKRFESGITPRPDAPEPAMPVADEIDEAEVVKEVVTLLMKALKGGKGEAILRNIGRRTG